ncbi:PrgI family mobile element protein, partial [Streptococcus sobrinus]
NFHKEIDDFERGIIGSFTGRQIVMLFGLIVGIGIATTIAIFQLPSILMYLALGLIVPPSVIFGLKRDEQIKEYLRFKLRIQERSYMTEFESEDMYGNQFIQEKGVREWASPDQGGEEAGQAITTSYEA